MQQNGYLIVPFDAKADIYIVNTCSVTNIADRKSRQMLHKAKTTNPDAIVVACGCYVQTGLDTLKTDDSIDIIIGNNEKNNVLEVIRSYETDLAEGHVERPMIRVRDMSVKQPYEEVRVGTYSDRTRDFVKIQDGCDRFCTYCIIPYARGRVRSRTQDDVVSEVIGMVSGGCREIVLTGIHVSSYGADRGGSELLSLLNRLQDIDGLERIRLSSLEPGIITPDFVAGISALTKVCPHFHLSMQSGSESVLKRMNRHYTPDEYYEKVELLRSAYDDPAITTDVIVGFPGETEDEFEETYRFIERVRFYELHVFKYSKRTGTPAATMPGQLTEREKARRSEILIELGNRLAADYRRAHIGHRTTVLTEEYKMIDGIRYLIGHTPEYICAGIRSGQPGPNHLVDGIYGDPLDPEILLFLPDTGASK